MKHHGQTTETQAVALQEYAARRGFEVVAKCRDEGISGESAVRASKGNSLGGQSVFLTVNGRVHYSKGFR
jgi:hypothetical protein